jgi:hypothetical protein
VVVQQHLCIFLKFRKALAILQTFNVCFLHCHIINFHVIQSVREWSPKNFRVSLSGKIWSKTFIPFLDKINRFLKIKLFPAVFGL